MQLLVIVKRWLLELYKRLNLKKVFGRKPFHRFQTNKVPAYVSAGLYYRYDSSGGVLGPGRPSHTQAQPILKLAGSG